MTTYTYDPSGNPTVTGTANDWPFQYRGMEKEFTDPAPYYYSGSGQFYSPQLVRSLSEAGQTSTSGSNGGPAGNAVARSGGGGGVPTAVTDAAAADTAATAAFNGGYIALNLLGFEKIAPLYGAGLVPGIVATAALALFDIFDAIFGNGGSNPPLPRQLDHGRHPLYPDILAVSVSLIVDEVSAGKPPICGDPAVCNKPPNQKKDPAPGPTNGDSTTTPGQNPPDMRCTVPIVGPLIMGQVPGILGCCQAHDLCYVANGCNSSSWLRTHPPFGACNVCNAEVVLCVVSGFNSFPTK